MKKQVLASILVIASGVAAHAANGEATAKAKQIVTTALAIEKISDLDFGSAAQGDQAKTVEPGTADNNENASFKVTGEPQRAYTITLPANNSVVMTVNGGGTADTEIQVSDFKSFPEATGVIGANGQAELLVGASRAALLANQTVGSYEGDFTVTVVY